MESVLLSTAYLPPVEYLQKIKNAQTIYIEKYEHYQKQSYRNRCKILTANGVLSLSIPIIQTHQKQAVTDVKISYRENWQQQHWRAIESAYRNSPYFIYYADTIQVFYQKKYDFLFDYNQELLLLFLNFLKLEKETKFTENYIEVEAENDFRNYINPKREPNLKEFKPYSQVFTDRFTFQANLSCLDLLFNKGNYSSEYF